MSQENTNNSDTTINFKRSTDNGKSFEDTKVLTNISSEESSAEPLMKANGKNIYVIWQQTLPVNNFTIFATRSTDNGSSFEEPYKIYSKIGELNNPRLYAEGGNVYFLSSDDKPTDNFFSELYEDVTIMRSTDNGTSFSEPQYIGAKDEINSYGQSLVSLGSNLYILSLDFSEHSDDVILTRSTDNGSSFEEPKKLGSGDSVHNPLIVTDENNVYVAWKQYNNYNNSVLDENERYYNGSGIMFTRSNDNGLTFTTAKKLINNTNSEESSEPLLEIAGKNIYIIWIEGDEEYKTLAYMKSIDNGTSFSSPIYISDKNKGKVEKFLISESGDQLYVLWVNERSIPNDKVIAQLYLTSIY
jgi:hypothetical protein